MKKKKLKIKKRVIVLVVLLILIALLAKPTISILKIKNKGYSLSISYKIYKEGIKEKVLDNKYSKTLENIISTDFYDEKNLNNYFEIKYIDKKDFNDNITKLIKNGYNSEEINKVYSKNDDKLIGKLVDKYYKDITEYIDFDFFKLDKLDRYINYYNGDYKDTIIKVNIGLDKEFFEDPIIVKDYSVDLIVNKYNKLDEKFVPKDITELDKCSSEGEFLAKDAKKAYDELCDASLKAGMSLGVTSSYRSYDGQKKIYDSSLKEKGEEYTKQYVATPGYSEHQTGLALDVKSLNSSPFKTTKEYKWMKDNSYKYGFILRYPEDKENITGYNPEAWHFRYVGKEIAKYIYENKITFEEYCAIFM